MTKELEYSSVMEQANCMILKMISSPQEPATSAKMRPTTPVGSPCSLAIKRTKVELEFMQEAARMLKIIIEIEEELSSARRVCKKDAKSLGLLRIEGELKVLKVR